ncbi:uncharacterized protein LOC141827898 [Curcuma longa]|uniref:uncharacterized protein LOC141827898 n=1 Tax=Curcuma longa TaxID=136217 RepID=UPI003D9EF646
MFHSSYSDSGLHPLFFSGAAATTTAAAYPAPPHELPRSYLQRSSAHSLPFFHHHILNSNASPMRRVLSAGDLQISPPGTNHRVGRYSAEERKERIERYRSKRNQRNFRRKITYACRKTLADSRPRVRGRFKRNGEMETETEAANRNSFEFYSYDDADQKQSESRRKVEVDWRSQLQAALATEDQTESYYDEELLAGFADAFSINIFS